MEKDNRNPYGGGDQGYSIDEILEEARRRQKEREEERRLARESAAHRQQHTQTDIDQLLKDYAPDTQAPSVSPVQEKAPSGAQVPSENSSPAQEPAPTRPQRRSRRFRPAAFTMGAPSEETPAAEEPDSPYISPFPEAEFETPEPVQTGFTEYIKHTQKAQPQQAAPSPDGAQASPCAHPPQPAEEPAYPNVFSGDHLYYLGQDQDEESEPPEKLLPDHEAVSQKTKEAPPPAQRFIQTSHTIHTQQEPVNVTIQQEDAAPAEEKFIKRDPVKTQTADPVNNPDPDALPVKRFIHPPTVKTGPLPAINAPEDYLLGDGGKYIKIPEDYIDPFAEKTFNFYGEEDTLAMEDTPADGNTITAPGGKAKEPEPSPREELAGQIRLDGFDETDPVETIDEEKAEQMVMENRKEKVSRFQLHEEAKSKIVETLEKTSSPEKPLPAFEKELDFEYRSPNDAARIREELNVQRAYQALKILGLGIIELLLLWLGLFAQFGTGIPAGLSPAGNPAAFLGVNLLLTLAAGAIAKNTVINGVKSALGRRFGAESVLTACLATVILHNGVLIGFMDSVSAGACHLYNAVAVLSLLCAAIGKFVKLTRIAYNFRFLHSKGEKQAVCPIENPDDAEELARGALVDDINLCYSAPVDFPSGFLTASKAPDRWEKKSVKYMPWLFAAAGLVFLLSWIFQKSFTQALSGFTVLTCICAPLTLLLAGNLPLRAAGKTLNANGAMIAGFESVEQFADVNGVLLDAADLFPAGSTQLYGIKAFHGMRIDDAILYAAGVLHASGGPLASAFDQVIEQREEILPKIEELTYEDGLGLSSWIYDHRILLGTREMMLHHGVEMPPATVEKKYLQGDPDRRALYMAVAGRLAAMFVVGYEGSPKIASMLCALEDNGVCLLLRTADPNVDEAMISRYFEISQNSVKILSSAGGLMYTEKLHIRRDKAPAHIVHNGTLRAFLGAVITSIRLKEKIHFSMVLQAFGVGLGFLLVAFFSIFAGLTQIGPFQLLVYQLFWGLVVALIASLRRL